MHVTATSHQTHRIRALAQELRAAAADTAQREYRAKFEQTARELEARAAELERRARTH